MKNQNQLLFQEQSGSEKGFNVGAPSFDDLESVDNSDAISSVIDCVNQLANADSNCTRELHNSSVRESKEFDEAVSFILSIEPVQENVKVIEDELDIEPRNPKAIFVMLPNIEVNDITQEVTNEAVEDTLEASKRLIDGFVVDQTVGDRVEGDTEEEHDTGSGNTAANHP